MRIPDLSDIAFYWFEIKVIAVVTLATAFGYWARYTQEAFRKQKHHGES